MHEEPEKPYSWQRLVNTIKCILPIISTIKTSMLDCFPASDVVFARFVCHLPILSHRFRSAFLPFVSVETFSPL